MDRWIQYPEKNVRALEIYDLNKESAEKLITFPSNVYHVDYARLFKDSVIFVENEVKVMVL